MKEQDIINLVLERLERNLNVRGKWQQSEPAVDGRLELYIDDKTVCFYAEVKREIRNYQIEPLKHKADKFSPFIVVANHISSGVKEQLRLNGIAYAETSGNIYLRQGDILLWIEGNKRLIPQKERTNRAFSKTGLKVIFQLLQDENFINFPYREIAARCKIGLGNVGNIINGLKEDGFAVPIGKNRYRLVHSRKLLDKWVAGYAERLQPALEIGTFRFAQERRWQDLDLHTDATLWGGEPAGALLTQYLQPGLFTLYTAEPRIELMKNYHLLPDPAGNLKAYKMFWHQQPNGMTAPPLLVYTDLINSNEPRCIETARRVYDEYLADKFR